MKKLLMTAILASVACGAGAMNADVASPASRPAGFTCEQPVFPSYSTSSDGARRVEKRLAQWNACARDFLARSDDNAGSAAVAALDLQVGLEHGTWLNRTMQYSNGQAMGKLAQVLVERDHLEQLRARYVRHGAPVYASERLANVALIQQKMTE